MNTLNNNAVLGVPPLYLDDKMSTHLTLHKYEFSCRIIMICHFYHFFKVWPCTYFWFWQKRLKKHSIFGSTRHSLDNKSRVVTLAILLTITRIIVNCACAPTPTTDGHNAFKFKQTTDQKHVPWTMHTCIRFLHDNCLLLPLLKEEATLSAGVLLLYLKLLFSCDTVCKTSMYKSNINFTLPNHVVHWISLSMVCTTYKPYRWMFNKNFRSWKVALLTIALLGYMTVTITQP